MDWMLQQPGRSTGRDAAPGRRGDLAPDPVRAALAAVAAARRAGERGPDHLALPPRGEGVRASTSRSWPRSGSRLVLLAVFMLSEAVLSVERTGLPYLTIMVDDSASERIADQYEQPETSAALEALASQACGRRADPAPSRRPAPAGAGEATRLAIAKGLILKDDARLHPRAAEAAQGPALPASPTRPGCWPRSTVPRTSPRRSTKLRRVEATGSQSRLGDGIRQVLTELRGRPPSAIVLLTDGQTTEGEPLAKAAELAARKGVPLFTIGLGSAEPARDLELTELLVDDVVFVDDAVRFQAKLLARGFAGPEGRRPAQGARPPGSRRPAEPPRARDDRGRRAPPTASPSASSWSTGPRRPASAPSSSRSSPGPASSRPRTTGSSASSTSARRSSRSCSSTASRATSSATSRTTSSARRRST